MNKILHQKPDAVNYARSFFVDWKNYLEADQGSKFLNNDGVGKQFSKSFLSLFLRYAHTHWPENLSSGHYELAIRDDKFRAAHYEEIKHQINHDIFITKSTRRFLIALMTESLNTKKTGRRNADGWHHLLAVVIHNVSLKYDLTIGEEDYSNGRSAQAAVIMALSDLFPGSDIDYRQDTASIHGTIPGRELLNKTWEKWRLPLRPAGRKEQGFSDADVIETHHDIFYAFYLSHFGKLIERLTHKRHE